MEEARLRMGGGERVDIIREVDGWGRERRDGEKDSEEGYRVSGRTG